jgi:hypothetical protein
MAIFLFAESVGFEPTDLFRGQHISSVLLSAAQPTLQILIIVTRPSYLQPPTAFGGAPLESGGQPTLQFILILSAFYANFQI